MFLLLYFFRLLVISHPLIIAHQPLIIIQQVSFHPSTILTALLEPNTNRQINQHPQSENLRVRIFLKVSVFHKSYLNPVYTSF